MTEPTRKTKSKTRAHLRTAWRETPPSRFLDYKDFLRSVHAAVERQVGRYSFQRFSEDLGFTSANAAYIVTHGYRKLNDEQSEAVVTTLGMTGQERRYFLRLRDYTDASDELERQKLFRDLVEIKEQGSVSEQDRLMLRFFSEWHHAAIFELVGLPEFRSDPAWISERFYKRPSVQQCAESLQLLEQLGLVRYDQERGRHLKTKETLSTGDDVRGMAVVGFHLQMLQLGQAALSQVPHDQREIGALTLPANESMVRRLKEDLQLIRRYAVFLSEQCQEPDRIVQLNFQLFSLTQT